MAIWCTSFEFELAGSGVAAHYKLQWLFGELQIKRKQKKRAKLPLLSAVSCHTRPDLSRIVCRGQEGSKEDTFRPDCQANT
jgi:hypothetical protein